MNSDDEEGISEYNSDESKYQDPSEKNVDNEEEEKVKEELEDDDDENDLDDEDDEDDDEVYDGVFILNTILKLNCIKLIKSKEKRKKPHSHKLL